MACCFHLTCLQSLLCVVARVVLLKSDVDPPDFMMPRGTMSPGGLGCAPVKRFSQNLRASLPSFCLVSFSTSKLCGPGSSFRPELLSSALPDGKESAFKQLCLMQPVGVQVP